jgi:hypothetical protein
MGEGVAEAVKAALENRNLPPMTLPGGACWQPATTATTTTTQASVLSERSQDVGGL